MATRLQIVDEARQWLGTPYVHQGHTKGLACDCAGLVAGVAVSLGIVPDTWWQNEGASYSGYGRQPANGMLERICDGFMERVDSLEIGNVVGLRWSKETQHLGIIAPYCFGGLSLVHALESSGKVIEHRLADVWLKRITHIWQMPGIE